MTGVRVGVTMAQFTSDPARFQTCARLAEKLGFDSLWVFDHLWPLNRKSRPILECWTALAHLAGWTERCEVGTLVTRSSLRHPALLARMALTVGAINPGRVIVGLGSGDRLNKAENEAFGAPYLRGVPRVAQLVSTIEVLGRSLQEERTTYRDDHAHVDLPPGPPSSGRARVWVGGRSVELMEVAGRIADGWNGWGANLDTFVQDAAQVRHIAGERAFDISWAGQVILGKDDASARELLGTRDPLQFVVGGPDTVLQQLQRAVSAGAGHLIVALPEVNESSLEALAEVAARLR